MAFVQGTRSWSLQSIDFKRRGSLSQAFQESLATFLYRAHSSGLLFQVGLHSLSR